LKAQDLNGNTFEYECGGLLARCIQHELDHLDGFLFVDRMDEEDRKNIEFKLFRLKKNGKRKEYNRPWK
jgi:peptide deformylase